MNPIQPHVRHGAVVSRGTSGRRPVLAALLVVSAMPLSAATVTFVGLAPNPAQASFWHIAANWSPAVLPGLADDALLGAFQVEHQTGNTAVNSFVSGAGGSLRLTGGSLAYVSASSAFDYEQSFGSQLSGSSLFRVTGSGSLLSGTQRGTGVTELASGSGAHQVGSMTFTEGRTLRNLGTLTQTANSTLDVVVTSASTSRFVNDGSFGITSGAQRSLNPNNGVVVVGMMTNNGSITKTGAGTYGFDSLDQRGTLDVAAGRIHINRVASFADGSVTGGAGALSLWNTNSLLDVATGANTSALHLRIEASGATLQHAGDMSVQTLVQADGIVDGAGKLTPLNSASLGFGIHRGAGVTELGVGAGPYTIGSMSFQSGRTLRNVGTLTQTADSVLEAWVATDTKSRLINDGSLHITSGEQRSRNTGTGVVTADMVTNNGSITKTGAGTYRFDSLEQNGTLAAQSGALVVNGPVRLLAGETDVAPSASLVLRDRNAQLAGGVLSVDGNLTTDVSNARLLQTGGVLQGHGLLRDAWYSGPGDFLLSSTGGRLTAGDQQGVGQLSIDAGISLSGGVVLEVDILSLTSFDRLAVSRVSLLGGSVQVDALDPGLALNVGDRFVIASFGSGYSGTFTGVSAPSPFNGFFVDFQVVYTASTVELVVGSLAPVPEPATWGLMSLGVGGLLWWRRCAQRGRAGVALAGESKA